MFDLVRKIVAGPKIKTPYNGGQLDLTYITDRVIAMAFPASNLIEKGYRNSMTDVINYFHDYHLDNYLIINVSNRQYDHQYFEGRVKDYKWPDHQAPPLTTLIQIAYDIKTFLDTNDSVVAVHCNHGKGRTGTAIIGLMLFLGLHHDVKESLRFYNQRRFNVDTYGVDQPCQTRYLQFIQTIKQQKNIPTKIIAYNLVKATQKGLSENCYITIKQVRTAEIKYPKVTFNEEVEPKTNKPIVMGDIFIEVIQNTWKGNQRIARINYNTFFLNPQAILNIQKLQIKFQSSQLKLEQKKDRNFQIAFDFEYNCLCHVEGSMSDQCECHDERVMEQFFWHKMISELKQVNQIEKNNNHLRYFYQQHLKEQMPIKKDERQTIYELSTSMSTFSIVDQQALGHIITKPTPISKIFQSEEDNQ